MRVTRYSEDRRTAKKPIDLENSSVGHFEDSKSMGPGIRYGAWVPPQRSSGFHDPCQPCRTFKPSLPGFVGIAPCTHTKESPLVPSLPCLIQTLEEPRKTFQFIQTFRPSPWCLPFCKAFTAHNEFSASRFLRKKVLANPCRKMVCSRPPQPPPVLWIGGSRGIALRKTNSGKRDDWGLFEASILHRQRSADRISRDSQRFFCRCRDQQRSVAESNRGFLSVQRSTEIGRRVKQRFSEKKTTEKDRDGMNMAKNPEIPEGYVARNDAVKILGIPGRVFDSIAHKEFRECRIGMNKSFLYPISELEAYRDHLAKSKEEGKSPLTWAEMTKVEKILNERVNVLKWILSPVFTADENTKGSAAYIQRHRPDDYDRAMRVLSDIGLDLETLRHRLISLLPDAIPHADDEPHHFDEIPMLDGEPCI